MSERPSPFPAYVGVLFGLLGLFVSIGLFNQYMVHPGMEVGEEHKAYTLARMYGIVTGIPIGGLIGFWIGKLIQSLRKGNNKESPQ